SSGWLGAALPLGLAYFLTNLQIRRRIPLMGVVGLLVYVFFLSPGKDAYRATNWQQGQSGALIGGGSIVDRTQAWVTAAGDQWQLAIQDPAGNGPLPLLQTTLGRVSLLRATANVVDRTPSLVPYQNGATYSFLVYGWIPRFIWPDKPSANDANQYYQVAYGL